MRADPLLFSPRPNRAEELAWHGWGKEAFDRAAELDRPVFLSLTASWCDACHSMDEETFSNPGIARILSDEVVPIRVDADRLPHVRDRYIAGGWPTNALLTPTGEVLWSDTFVTAERLRAVAEQVLDAWKNRRHDLQQEIERRHRALDAARSRRSSGGIARREAADDVLSVLQADFDARNGGFGQGPKFPGADPVELLYLNAGRLGAADWLEMADRTLDGMLAGELWDRRDGGFFRYALQPDWTEPQFEKLLSVNAEMLRALALGAALRGRDDWVEVAQATVRWADAFLALPGGLWSGSQDGDPAYYAPEAPGASAAPRVDAIIYTDANAAWIRALAEAGGRLGRDDWVARAAEALDVLLAASGAPDGLFHHYRMPDGEAELPGLLVDSVEVGRACVAVAQAAGRPDLLERAASIVRDMEAAFWSDDGGFLDNRCPDPVGALRFQDRPLEQNAGAARLLIDLSLGRGSRTFRALAERVLATFSPSAGRYGVAAAGFAVAAEEFFDPPVCIVVVGDPERGAPLRRAALSIPRPDRRVWTLPEGGSLGRFDFDASGAPAAFVVAGGSCSGPIRKPGRIAEAALSPV